MHANPPDPRGAILVGSSVDQPAPTPLTAAAVPAAAGTLCNDWLVRHTYDPEVIVFRIVHRVHSGNNMLYSWGTSVFPGDGNGGGVDEGGPAKPAQADDDDPIVMEKEDPPISPHDGLDEARARHSVKSLVMRDMLEVRDRRVPQACLRIDMQPRAQPHLLPPNPAF